MIRKLSLFACLAVCLSSLAHAKEDRPIFKIYDFSKGVDTYHNATTLPDGFVQNAQNVLFDAQAPVQKRAGFTTAVSTKAYSYTGLWTYTDSSNTTWLLFRSSDQITASNLAGTTVLVATVSVNNAIGETNAFGNAYFVDQTQGVYFWNGSVISYVAGSPKGSIITSFHGRLWVTGAAVPNGNQLYGSQYFVGTNWTTSVNPTDPVQYSVGLQDNFDNITAEYVYLDTLYIFKHYAIYALYGFDQTSFQISQLTQECGCIDGNTIQTFNGAVEFVSLRGVESFNGYSCKRISDSVKDKVDAAVNVGGFGQLSWVQQSATDWNAGTFSPSGSLSSTLAPPTLVLSTFSATENSSTQWNLGTASNISVGVSSLSLALNNSGNLTNNDFESAFSGNWTATIPLGTWTQVGVTFGVSPKSGSSMASFSIGQGTVGTWTFEAIDLNNNLVQSVSYTPSANTWTQGTLSPTNPGKRVKFRFHGNDSGSDYYLTTSDSYIWGGPITFWHNLGVSGLFRDYFQDLVQNGSSTITSGSFTSQVFNTGTSSNIYSLNGFSYSVNTSSPSFSLQTSTASSGPWSTLLTATGTNAAGNQYAQYVTTISITSSDDALTAINSISVIATASTGTLKTQIHNVSAMNSWGNFSVVDTLSGGNIVFSVCSSTNSNMGTPTSCTVQTPNSQINSATGTYVQWYATFTVTAATQTPTLNSGTVQWFTGNKVTPMSSTVWDNRYWLSLTTNTVDTVNDAVLVLNTRGAWAPFDIHAGAFTQYKNSLYHADSNSTGNIYLDNQGFTDNGVPITAFIKTKNDTLGDFAANDYLYALYPSAFNTGACTMTTQYSFDGLPSASLRDVLLSEYSGSTTVKLPFPVDSSHKLWGQSINFTFGTKDASCDWQFYGAEGIFRTRRLQ